jgi:hypothetical protein
VSARNISYRVTWPTCTRYYVALAEAMHAAKTFTDPDVDGEDAGAAVAVHKVQLVRDAFERAVNGGGGYEENEWLRWSAPSLKFTVGSTKSASVLCINCGTVHETPGENCPE